MKQFGAPPASENRHQHYLQTERATHEAWASLIADAPMAARLMHMLVNQMDSRTNAVVASQSTLGELLSKTARPIHRNTVRRAIRKLVDAQWIEVVELGGKGGALAYVVNDRVAWGRPRNELRYSRFSAQVIASSSEQSEPIDERPPLRRVPILMRGEQQLPAGPNGTPPTQTIIEGLEPDLPAVHRDDQESE